MFRGCSWALRVSYGRAAANSAADSGRALLAAAETPSQTLQVNCCRTLIYLSHPQRRQKNYSDGIIPIENTHNLLCSWNNHWFSADGYFSVGWSEANSYDGHRVPSCQTGIEAWGLLINQCNRWGDTNHIMLFLQRIRIIWEISALCLAVFFSAWSAWCMDMKINQLWRNSGGKNFNMQIKVSLAQLQFAHMILITMPWGEYIQAVLLILHWNTPANFSQDKMHSHLASWLILMSEWGEKQSREMDLEKLLWWILFVNFLVSLMARKDNSSKPITEESPQCKI